jgi:hypothetical protein
VQTSRCRVGRGSIPQKSHRFPLQESLWAGIPRPALCN